MYLSHLVHVSCKLVKQKLPVTTRHILLNENANWITPDNKVSSIISGNNKKTIYKQELILKENQSYRYHLSLLIASRIEYVNKNVCLKFDLWSSMNPCSTYSPWTSVCTCDFPLHSVQCFTIWPCCTLVCTCDSLSTVYNVSQFDHVVLLCALVTSPSILYNVSQFDHIVLWCALVTSLSTVYSGLNCYFLSYQVVKWKIEVDNYKNSYNYCHNTTTQL